MFTLNQDKYEALRRVGIQDTREQNELLNAGYLAQCTFGDGSCNGIWCIDGSCKCPPSTYPVKNPDTNVITCARQQCSANAPQGWCPLPGTSCFAGQCLPVGCQSYDFSGNCTVCKDGVTRESAETPPRLSMRLAVGKSIDNYHMPGYEPYRYASKTSNDSDLPCGVPGLAGCEDGKCSLTGVCSDSCKTCRNGQCQPNTTCSMLGYECGGKDSCGCSCGTCPQGMECNTNSYTCVNPNATQCSGSQCSIVGGLSCPGPFGLNGACPSGYSCRVVSSANDSGVTSQMCIQTGPSNSGPPRKTKDILDAVLQTIPTIPGYLNVAEGVGVFYSNSTKVPLKTSDGKIIKSGSPIIWNLLPHVPLVFNKASVFNAHPTYVGGNYGNLPNQTNLQVFVVEVPVSFLNNSTSLSNILNAFTPDSCNGGACSSLGGGMPFIYGLRGKRLTPWIFVPVDIVKSYNTGSSTSEPKTIFYFSIWAGDPSVIQCPQAFMPSVAYDPASKSYVYSCARIPPNAPTHACKQCGDNYCAECDNSNSEYPNTEEVSYFLTNCPKSNDMNASIRDEIWWNASIPNPLPSKPRVVNGFIYNNSKICDKDDCSTDLIPKYVSMASNLDDVTLSWLPEN